MSDGTVGASLRHHRIHVDRSVEPIPHAGIPRHNLAIGDASIHRAPPPIRRGPVRARPPVQAHPPTAHDGEQQSQPKHTDDHKVTVARPHSVLALGPPSRTVSCALLAVSKGEALVDGGGAGARTCAPRPRGEAPRAINCWGGPR